MNANLQHEEIHDGAPSRPLRRQRLKISNACQACRLRKVKCDGGRPTCLRCQTKGKPCSYSRESVAGGQQAQHKLPVGNKTQHHNHATTLASPPASRAHSIDAPSTTETPNTTGLSSRSEHLHEDQDPDPEHGRPIYTAHGRFAGEVAAAIDVRAGLAPAATSNLVPFVDAPLFGEMDLHSMCSVLNSTTELPPRPCADMLISIYWQHIHSGEPILDQERFFHDFEVVYSAPGAVLHADRDIWLSSLNVVFALAVQIQESTPLQKRNEEGNRYFQRAWSLLRPEAILWKPGSIEMVQCLMLMNRYLHCTNNQHKTWMTAGLAMRIAQSLSCHLSEAPSANKTSCDRHLKQRVWASCVALDRCVSWSLGRTSVPSLIPLPNRFSSVSLRGSSQQESTPEHLTRKLELHEIGNQIQLAQTQTRNGLVAKLGLPRLYQDEYQTVAVQLDACLNRWEDNLPSDWKLQHLHKLPDRSARAERYLLHLRLLHSRIFLYRPMLARYYSMNSHTATSQATPGPPSLSDRLLKECAGMCVETAQKVTSLIIETLEPEASIGLLPWWYRIYYLHIAGTNFLAAMFGPDLFTESVSQSWHSVLSALHAHEHLSTYVQQCIQVFETLSTRILQARQSNPDDNSGVPLHETNPGFFFDDIFQDVSFDFDNLLFGTEDIMGGPALSGVAASNLR